LCTGIQGRRDGRSYGISGGTSDQDEVLGQYARAKVGWAHGPANDNTPDDVKAHFKEIYGKVGVKNRAT